MNKKLSIFLIIAIILSFVAVVFIPVFIVISQENEDFTITATTSIASDIAINIVGEHAVVETLMPNGTDPHSYTVTGGDLLKLESADVILYCGLNLEGKMGDVFESYTDSGKNIIALADGLSEQDLIESDDADELYDPHFWFDPLLFIKTAVYFTEQISLILPDSADYFAQNLEDYTSELMFAHIYCLQKADMLSPDSKILITAHDAFSYFGACYDFTVMPLGGISTTTEVGVADIITLSKFIAENEVKSIFTEDSVSDKSINSLCEAVEAYGFTVSIGGTLYSDSLGSTASGADTYTSALKHNMDTIVSGLL